MDGWKGEELGGVAGVGAGQDGAAATGEAKHGDSRLEAPEGGSACRAR